MEWPWHRKDQSKSRKARKRGKEKGAPYPLSSIPLPFSLPPYPLPPNKTLQETITFTDNYYSDPGGTLEEIKQP